MRTVWTIGYSILYLLYSIPTLQKVKKVVSKNELPPNELDKVIFALPRRWAQKTIKRSGSTVNVVGNEKFPDGPVLIVANHQGNFDIMALLGYLEKPFGFIAKIETKKVPFARTWITCMHGIFIDREDRRQSVKAFKDGIETLKSGHSLLIFPEGTRSKGSQTLPFKSGSLRLATKAGVPIVPVAIDGTHKIMEANDGKVKPAKVTVTVCDPIMPEQYEELSLDQLAEYTQSQIIEVLQQNHSD
ncbi:1-acyl-sn-glycerol-3-phosphate acyltransferase [Salirhabdus euzebyi]|uniref:1-acyl-sn-glycerol-3-phosphate acyltransferase n=1 Tax=Salirhabdus euzebyi TaxID=394506 RepID=A0A841Q9K4_9BACI|nr:lysophospholipid acyltransferase family protein [Salirhabdus euzebyi]MBB6455369.1 1-acyl-sn-glycerol-3-phosphate acyltransferase [Salirhabdus euzebyi]